MDRFRIAFDTYAFYRSRTLALLERVAAEPDPIRVLGFRPGPGRAHIAWQVMHVAVTEELFATERLVPGSQPSDAALTARFRGGSVPDDDIPSLATIRAVLDDSRSRLIATLSTFQESQLGWISPALSQRQLTLATVLDLLAWHEAHHQGQAHLTMNLYKAANP
jgi:uncharacterized damage-inducible protein DinB